MKNLGSDPLLVELYFYSDRKGLVPAKTEGSSGSQVTSPGCAEMCRMSFMTDVDLNSKETQT
jgi:hypothetical protein